MGLIHSEKTPAVCFSCSFFRLKDLNIENIETFQELGSKLGGGFNPFEKY